MSATNSKFEIAVAVPVLNSSFRYLNRFSATGSTITASQVTLSNLKTESYTVVDGNASEVMAVGDRLTFKSSDGETATALLTAVPATGLVVDIDTCVSGDTPSGSVVLGYGDGVPGGWYVNGIFGQTGMTISKDLGYNDDFALEMYFPYYASGGTDFTLYIQNSIETAHYVPSLRYRTGAMMKASVGSTGSKTPAATVGIRRNNGSEYSSITILSDTQSSVTDWSGCTGTVYFTGTTQSTTALDVCITLNRENSVNSKATYLYVDDVFLEHVYNPVTKKTIYGNSAAGSTGDTSVGYYEIDDYPELGSINYKILDNQTEIILHDNSLSLYDPNGWGERNNRYELTCNFVNSSTTVFEYLRKLMNIQKNGYKLNLHTYIAKLPSVLTGYLFIENVNYAKWDFGLVDYDFRFREA